MKINLKTTALTIVGLLLLSAGCQDSLTTDTAARGKETIIGARCIVTFFHGEAAGYISEQKHVLRPALGDIDSYVSMCGNSFLLPDLYHIHASYRLRNLARVS